MRVGLVVECQKDGPDAAVYSYLAERVPGIEIVKPPICMGNKRNLLGSADGTVPGAGIPVSDLFVQGKCDRVLVIWDLYPASWEDGQTQVSVAADMVKLQTSLANAGVSHPCVYPICVEAMMETWFLADGNALSAVARIPKKRPKIKGEKSPSTYREKTKDRLTAKFFGNKHSKLSEYNDYKHALAIASELDVAVVSMTCPQITDFFDSLTQNPCAPPLAWQVPAAAAALVKHKVRYPGTDWQKW